MKKGQTSTAAQSSLIFIPDISGFTEFVNTTEIDHARHIIEELLEILIDANEIGLEISEIEGDAILFYRFGKAPTAAELLAQVQKMYVKFQAHLKRYEAHRICQCGACCTANNLNLKFIIHFGNIATKQVKEYSKLFGKDVILAHRLLKNDINRDEYALFTDQLIGACSTWVEVETVAWDKINHTSGEYDIGEVKYCFISLAALMDHVPEPQIKDFSLPGAIVEVFQSEGLINAPIEMVFNVVSDLSFRHHWFLDLIRVDELNTKITQNGSVHRCIVNEKESDPLYVSHDFKKSQDLIAFTETRHRDRLGVVYTLRKIGPHLTRIQANGFMKKNLLKYIIVTLFIKKRLVKKFDNSWERFDNYYSSLVKEGKEHPAQIVLG